ncbi:MSMEG_1061 family FMN-dependent PPOX-type flavoprotein [Rhizobium halophytocola]|uniref:PPOX class probable FMN-dependent enzyme n=1 Tax=Rhizobium halophytocola TaxID=735519 RepID=A0ABS4DZ46_9HYPH|nr:MSMEG_1061 family FMN-dependent PPOX-type flavoprotein [Rhizobium halophytocola]MBP1850957.1 PPOX class probable FMN-dependent enzyme [Rhizobium halophytocola]
MTILRSIEDLRAIYAAEPTEASVAKVTRVLTAEYQTLIGASPFMALATVGPEGLDCSPRGDEESVVRIADERTLLLPDWRGNNRIDSLANIVRDPRVALMFLIPGSSTVMRVNGTGEVSVAPDLLQSFERDGKHPRTVVVVTVVEAYFQCARAVMRAGLWAQDRVIDPQSLPTPGALLKAAKAGFDQETYDREWAARAAQTMW